MNAIEMVGRCMVRQDPNIPPPVPYSGSTFEQTEGHDGLLACVADEGVVEGCRAIVAEPTRNDAGDIVG